MTRHLLLTVRLHGDGHGTARFHGVAKGNPEWPPSPARVFQALVAGAARGHAVPDAMVPAFKWLEGLPPPVIAAPIRKLGQSVGLFVPNNDADALSDPRDVSGIRTRKVVQPSLFPEDEPFLYAWTISGDAAHADVIVASAAELYQLGRGVDMAWAIGEVLDEVELEARLQSYRGVIYRPALGARGVPMLACPTAGSLASLVKRHRSARFHTEVGRKKARTHFTNAPKPRFVSVSYDRARTRVLFELHDRSADKPWPWPLGRVVHLVEMLRDAAAARLRHGLPGHEQAIESSLVGRKADGRDSVPIEHRVHIVPLPSIGFIHADRAIRRFVLSVPKGAPLSTADVEWAFSGLEWAPPTGEASALIVTQTDDEDMLRHYAGPSRRWRSVTAVALPERAKRRRIEPSRMREEAKNAAERIAEEDRAVDAVHAALRHAGIHGIATVVHVQREPFEAKGVRADVFAESTRFAKERLWHVEIELDRPVHGPLVIGDGRFLGLGVMAPVDEVSITQRTTRGETRRRPTRANRNATDLLVLHVDGAVNNAPVVLARALRRAVMARVKAELGAGTSLDTYFTGHEVGGEKASGNETNHLAFHWDPRQRRLLVIVPHVLERRDPTWDERRKLDTLTRALEKLVDLRAGAAGRCAVRLVPAYSDDPLLAPSHRWKTLTPYAVTRHQNRSAYEVLANDVLINCERHGLPRPKVTVLEACGVPGQGLEGHVELDFAVAVEGPIALGRTRYLGGGLFAPEVSS